MADQPTAREAESHKQLDRQTKISPADEPASAIRRPKRRRRSKASAVELEIDGVAVKISRGADAGVIAAVIEALRATR